MFEVIQVLNCLFSGYQRLLHGDDLQVKCLFSAAVKFAC